MRTHGLVVLVVAVMVAVMVAAIGGCKTSKQPAASSSVADAAVALDAVPAAAPTVSPEQIAAWDKACQGGVAESCYNLGVAYYKGNGVVQDFAKAVALYDKACQAGVAQGCAARDKLRKP